MSYTVLFNASDLSAITIDIIGKVGSSLVDFGDIFGLFLAIGVGAVLLTNALRG